MVEKRILLPPKIVVLKPILIVIIDLFSLLRTLTKKLNCINFIHGTPMQVFYVPAFKKKENKSIIMDFSGLKCCKYNRFPCYIQTTKLNLKWI